MSGNISRHIAPSTTTECLDFFFGRFAFHAPVKHFTHEPTLRKKRLQVCMQIYRPKARDTSISIGTRSLEVFHVKKGYFTWCGANLHKVHDIAIRFTCKHSYDVSSTPESLKLPNRMRHINTITKLNGCEHNTAKTYTLKQCRCL